MITNFKKLRSALFNNLISIPGWRTSRKIVVIESDDWGSIRMPSAEAYRELEEKKIIVGSDPFNRFDNLESEDDLAELFDLLISLKDSQGNHPVITANFNVANPDFDKIRQSGFREYHYELFTETYARYPMHAGSFGLIRQGMFEGLLLPQFHGREHVHVNQWMRLLSSGVKDYRTAFDYGTYGLNSIQSGMADNNVMASFDVLHDEDRPVVLDSIRTGLDLFEKIFGYRSVSFIAPCYVWDDNVEEACSRGGVKYIQTLYMQYLAGTTRNGKYMKKYNIIGRQNRFGQRYLGRNCYFEPSTSQKYDWLNGCLSKMEAAFRWGKPAVISMHRLNFIGSIVPANRQSNLVSLKSLLINALEKWPDIEFMNSQQLGDLISGTNQ